MTRAPRSTWIAKSTAVGTFSLDDRGSCFGCLRAFTTTPPLLDKVQVPLKTIPDMESTGKHLHHQKQTMQSFRIQPDHLCDVRERQVDHSSGVHHAHSDPLCFYIGIPMKLMDRGIRTRPVPLQYLQLRSSDWVRSAAVVGTGTSFAT